MRISDWSSDVCSSDLAGAVEFDGTDYTVTRVRDGTVAYTGTSLSAEKIDGLSLSVDTSAGAPQAGDSWLVQPTRTAAGDIKLNLTDPAQIAAADTAGGSDNGANADRKSTRLKSTH